MFALIRRDSTIRALPLLLFKGVLFSTVFLFIYNIAYLHKQSGSLTFQVCAVWLIVGLFLILGKTGNRCSRFDMALPISTRKLWLSHTLAVILSGAILLAVTGGILIIGIQLLYRMPWHPPILERDLIDMAPHLGTGLILTVVALQSRNTGLSKIPKSSINQLLIGALIAGVLGLIILLIPFSPLFTLFPLGMAVALAIRSYRSLPEVFSIVPLHAQNAGLPSEEEWVELPRRYKERTESETITIGQPFEDKKILYKTIFRCLMKVEGFVKIPGLTIFYIVFLFLWGMLLAGFFSEWLEWDDDLRFTMIVITAYVLFALLRGQMNQLHILDSLPVARKTLFAVLMLPFFLFLSLGYGFGRIVVAGMQKQTERIKYVEWDDHHYVEVPYGFLKISWDGLPPDNKAHWGESHMAWKKSLRKGGRVSLYSPFHTPKGSSPDFVALQISRAVEAIYGRSIPPDEIKDLCLDVSTDGRVGLKGADLALLKLFPDMKRRSEGPLFPIFFLMVSLAWFVMVSIYFRFFRASVGEPKRIVVFIALMVISLGLHMAPYAAAIAGYINLGAASGFPIVLVREISFSLPGGELLIWIVCTLLFLGAYRLAQNQFERIEVPYKREVKNEF